MTLKGRNVLVIGGSSGIGAAVAQLAAEQGANVTIASSNPARIDNAVSKIRAANPQARIQGVVCDVSNDDAEAQLEKLFSKVNQEGSAPIDHLVYTAVRLDLRPLSQVSLEFLRQDSQFMFCVPALVAKVAPRYMKHGYTSSITFTSGQIAERPVKGFIIPTGWASAIIGLSRVLALDLAPIRVNVVSPGPTDTEAQGSEEVRAQRREAVAKTALLGKMGRAEEVAEAYVYLMRDTNNTGSVVSSNGGAVIQ